MADQEEYVSLKIEPRRRKLMINDILGKITKIEEGTFYGSVALDEGVLHVSVSAPTGRFNGTFKNKNGERTELGEMICTEGQFPHSSPANQRKTTLLSM